MADYRLRSCHVEGIYIYASLEQIASLPPSGLVLSSLHDVLCALDESLGAVL